MSDDIPLKYLYFYRYRINLCAREVIDLPPYKGNVFRGVFGYALRNIVCQAKHAECEGCRLRLQCVYSFLMGSPVSDDHPHAAKYKTPPRPYIIVPPLTRKRLFYPDEIFAFDITLVGTSNKYLSYFILAFIEMGKMGLGRNRGRFDVVTVEAIDADDAAQQVFCGRTGALKQIASEIRYETFENTMRAPNKITIFFETQARIKQHDKLAPDIPFQLLIDRLSERAFLLAHFYCGAELADHMAFTEPAGTVETVADDLKWGDWKRYSGSHKTEMTWGGWQNIITYKGNFQKYFPLLKAGEYLHVGKAATFGLGKYRVIPMETP